MSDYLANHATIVFEAHDNEEDTHDSSDQQKKWLEATKLPDRRVSLNQLYKEELENYENLQCRLTFFNALAFGYKSFDTVAGDLEMKQENFDLL